ncbi:vacuolar protein sorting-associated protein 72 [Coccidioides immitis RS]|uniref:Vacuolar protein sorting-associated protein 72 n=1 Tax=Coccidioides immitis (strain RS) TaxID=246410 RepID=J3KHP7_COCIM|nr:vacuolar protein sorting-associated protein 72 [Coccidioides immitis RS]EAS35414.3 vacuolar protein sorting-associated protein 72 [Coccidioides immitis RS]
MADSPETNDATSSDGEPIEYLATARARRSTAGQHMSSLLDAEADDDLALLFAEDEEDEEFTFGEQEEEGEDDGVVADYAEDMDLDSSSDEEDQGPDAKEDELEGERELEKQAKAERLAKKRKAQESLRLTALRKKVKIDPNLPSRSLTTPAPRQRKKSERISWLPTPEDGPTRSSSRMQTVRNKELTHARLKDSEQRRIRLIATMEEAARRKESKKAKQMTQEERLAEAEKTERINSKSLNRWEEMEKKRSEEQRARLEALQNRRLEGPVVTWWSGIAKWIDDKLAQVGVRSYTQAAEKEAGRKRKSNDVTHQGPPKAGQSKPSRQQEPDLKTEKAQSEIANSAKTVHPPANEDAPKDPKDEPKEPPGEGSVLLDGIHLYASMTDETLSVPADQSSTAQSAKVVADEGDPTQSTPGPTTTARLSEGAAPAPEPKEQDTPTKGAINHQASSEQPTPSVIPTGAAKPPSTQDAASLEQPSGPVQPLPPPLSPPSNVSTENHGTDSTSTVQAGVNETPPTQVAPKIEISSRNCIILEDFDATTPQARSQYSILFNPRKPQKLQKPAQEYCPVTGRPARYRDPQTGIGYANTQAYREIRQVLGGRYAWSGFLGCFVGELGGGARGVPERFLAPNVPPPQEILGPPPPVSGEGITVKSSPTATTAAATPTESQAGSGASG